MNQKRKLTLTQLSEHDRKILDKYVGKTGVLLESPPLQTHVEDYESVNAQK